MSMKKSLLIMTAILGILAVSCNKTDTLKTNLSLKQSISTGVTAVNNAVGIISSSQGYQILSANSSSLKSAETYTDSVTLTSIAGIYEFQPDPYHFLDFFIPHRLFVKTGTSDYLIVNMPQKLAFHPRFLHELYAPDSLLKKDFTIKATDYYYYLDYASEFDYRLVAGFTLDTVNIGNMVINAKATQAEQDYSSTYNFPAGYSLSVSSTSNDTTVTTFSLSKETTVLIKETVIATKPVPGMGMGPGQEFRHRERLYILTIGNVEIRRGAGLDSIQVYVDGVLQKHAGARIVDSTGTDGSICHKRDILLTFDDGTTENLSTLIDPAREALKTLVDALHSMNFAKNIVDYIAIGIDYNIHHH